MYTSMYSHGKYGGSQQGKKDNNVHLMDSEWEGLYVEQGLTLDITV